jgi:aspartyl/glutamyl-tRNA(Asn/Gln) amidotransferase C subunit
MVMFPIKQVARLARIEINQDEFEKELDSIFKWIDQLKTVDVENVDLYAFSEKVCEQQNAQEHKNMHVDLPTLKDLERNAPSFGFGMFQVPKVLE